MSEAESTALAVREVYSVYYSEMGGVGAAPEPKARTPTTEGKVVRFQRGPKPQPDLSTAHHSREANDPKIHLGTADFREHSGSDCRI